MTVSREISQQAPQQASTARDMRRTKDGYTFDANADHWLLGQALGINVTSLIDLSLSPKIESSLRQVLARMAEEYNPKTVRGYLSGFRKFAQETSGDTITSARLDGWLAKLRKDNREYCLAAVKVLLIIWNDVGYPGVSQDVVDYLDRLELKGHDRGKSVRKMCPYTGPYSQLEQQAIYAWANAGFHDGEISLIDYAWLFILLMTGRRPDQIRALRLCDLMAVTTQTGVKYSLRIPRAKQIMSTFRDEFTDLAITEDLYHILLALAQNSRWRVQEHLDTELPGRVSDQLPLFLHEARLRHLNSLEMLEQWLEVTPDALHASGGFNPLKGLSLQCTAHSERTGDYIALLPRRFRYTKGTNLGARGVSGSVIAQALDHRAYKLSSVGIYSANTEETAAQIDETMAKAMAPLAQAFAGTLIASEREAVFGEDPNRRIKNDGNDDVGSCGTNALCFSGHYACYVCHKFQPWRDAPHEKVLQAVLEQRERQAKKNVSSHVIQATDRTLLAVQDVIRMCAEARDKAAKKNFGETVI